MLVCSGAIADAFVRWSPNSHFSEAAAPVKRHGAADARIGQVAKEDHSDASDRSLFNGVDHHLIVVVVGAQYN